MLLFLFISFLSISLDWINALDQRFSKWGFSPPAYTEAERSQARLWDQGPTSPQVTLHTPRLWERPCSVQPRLGQPMTLTPRHCPPQEARSLPCYIPERPHGCCDFQVKCMAAWQCLQIWTLNSRRTGGLRDAHTCTSFGLFQKRKTVKTAWQYFRTVLAWGSPKA